MGWVSKHFDFFSKKRRGKIVHKCLNDSCKLFPLSILHDYVTLAFRLQIKVKYEFWKMNSGLMILFKIFQILLELARSRNSNPLPAIKPQCGIRLPPDRYCLSACNYRLRSTRKVSNLLFIYNFWIWAF